MSDTLMQMGTGRIWKEPTTTEKSLIVEVVSSLYDKTAEKKERPAFTRLILTGPLATFWQGRIGELVKGGRVSFCGKWTFNTFEKKDKTMGIGFTVFPDLFEVNPPRVPRSAAPGSEEPAAATTESKDELPF